MKKRFISFLTFVLFTLLLTGCCLKHDWQPMTCKDPETCSKCGKEKNDETLPHTYKDATCTDPQTCSECGKTKGEALGHTFKDATCTEAKTCSVCNATEGTPLGHTFKDATCTEAKICSVCGTSEGDPLGHTFKDATCTEAKICSVCGTSEGDPLGHSWVEASCLKPKHCSNCDLTEGEKGEHSWVIISLKAAKYCSFCGEKSSDPVTLEEYLLYDDASNAEPILTSLDNTVKAYPTVYKGYYVEVEGNDIHYIFYYVDSLYSSFDTIKERFKSMDLTESIESDMQAFESIYGVRPENLYYTWAFDINGQKRAVFSTLFDVD